MWDKYRIITVAITRDDYQGIRVTPNIYTTLEEIDTFIAAMEDLLKNGAAGDRVTPAQRRAAEEFKRLRGVEPFGPFVDLLASPELMTRVGAVGEYLRYRSALPPRLSEFAILVTAAEWQQRFEWEIHAPIASMAGIPQATSSTSCGRELRRKSRCGSAGAV